MSTIKLRLSILFILGIICYRNMAQSITKETIVIDKTAIDIISNDSLWIGDMLVLPGWNYSKEKWCLESDLCEKALQKGYRLILPEMGKSIYASHYFPETRKDWLQYPTLTWVADTMIPRLQQERKIFTTPENYLTGLSTGARGVILIAMKTGQLFKAGAALSGDYDQTKMPSDKLMQGYYGAYSSWKTRWQTTDNPTYSIEKLNIPIYFGHGKNDKVVPYSQTADFYTIAKAAKPTIRFVLNSPVMGHDFIYWNSEVDPLLKFFEGIEK